MTHSIPTSHTKVLLPRRRPEILTRPRLLDMMLEFLDKRLVLVSAPAGYGKTSLLIDLSHNSDLPFCWLAIDELDRDPQRFVAYFISSIAHRFPEFGNQSKSALNTLTSLEQGMEQLVVTLVNEVYDRIPQHFVIVLDDYHLVGDVPAIQTFLSRFLQLVDENCHLVISSRILINLMDIPLMVARDQVGGLDLTELAFRADEIQSLFAQNYDVFLSDRRAKELQQETEGWITGLQLSSLGVEDGVEQSFRVARAAGVDLFDYLGQQVLDRQPGEIRFFLLRSSLLEEFDANLCENVLGGVYPDRRGWQGWIDAVVRNNLFTLPVGLESGWIRYHHLFRDFLQARLRSEDPEEIEPILRRLAQVHEERQDWERSYHILKQLGDHQAMASLIERSAPHQFQKALVTLESWLMDLPPSSRKSRPGIISVQGNVEILKGNLKQGLDLLDRATEIFRSGGDVRGLVATLNRRAVAHRFLGNYQAALRDADEVIEMSEDDDSLQIAYADALRQKGLSLFRQGSSRHAVKVLERALGIYRRLGDASHIPILMMETGMAYIVIGQEQKTGKLFDEALQIWRRDGNLYFQANLLNNLGVLRLAQGEYEKALLALEEGLLCARRGGVYLRLEALLLISLGDLYAEVEDFELAQACFQQGNQVASEIGDRFLLNYLLLATTQLALRAGDHARTQQLLREAEPVFSTQSSQYEHGLFESLRGQFWLQQAEAERAGEAFRKAEASFSADGRTAEQARNQVWLAIANYLAKDVAGARAKLEQALRSEEQAKHSFVAALHQARSWVEKLGTDPAMGRPLRELLKRVDRMEARLPAVRRRLRRLARTMEVPDPTLHIRALGRTSVKVGGKLVSMSDWQTQSVRDLFFYFLMIPEPLTREQIASVFWPDLEDPAKIRLRFKNELYRLRRAVGGDAIQFENEFYAFNRSLDYEYDVETFENLLEQARSTRDADVRIELLEKAAGQFGGPFLEDVEGVWVWSERERLGQMFLAALVDLAEALRNANRVHEAIAACQRAIEYDPTLEAAYHTAMKIYGRINDRAGIVRLYDAYVEAMKQELDLPPSEEIEAFYQQLIR